MGVNCSTEPDLNSALTITAKLNFIFFLKRFTSFLFFPEQQKATPRPHSTLMSASIFSYFHPAVSGLLMKSFTANGIQTAERHRDTGRERASYGADLHLICSNIEEPHPGISQEFSPNSVSFTSEKYSEAQTDKWPHLRRKRLDIMMSAGHIETITSRNTAITIVCCVSLSNTHHTQHVECRKGELKLTFVHVQRQTIIICY